VLYRPDKLKDVTQMQDSAQGCQYIFKSLKYSKSEHYDKNCKTYIKEEDKKKKNVKT
jgi:hypothetical protein